MKILYLHQYFNTPSMAGGTRSYEMARRLVAWGHEVHMITTDRDGLFPQGQKWHETEEAGIHVHWTPIPYSNAMSYNERIRAFFAFSWRAARKAVAIGGDIVFATSTPLTIALPGVYASKRLKVPMVFEVRDLWPEVPIALGVLKNPLVIAAARWLERFAYRNSAHIVALAPGMKKHVAAKGYPEDKITVIPNGADVDFFDVPESEGRKIRDKYAWLGDRPLVLYAGTIGLVNNVGYLVDLAAATYPLNSQVRFVVIGEGKELPQIIERAKSAKIMDKSFFVMGSVPKKEMPAWLSAATVAISLIIEKKENWENAVTNKFFDAIAAGRPIASNHMGWQTDLALENKAGFVLSRDATEAAKKLLIEMSEKTMKDYGYNARQLAKNRFDRNFLAKELLRVFEARSLCGRAGGR